LSNPGIPFTILAFLLVIGPLIFVHELGHYFAGRWFGVKADTFSIGFGREITGWTDRRGTRWKVGWLPLGGYVKFKGDMNPASTPTDEWLSLSAAERAHTFQGKKLWQRFIIVAAGPLTNFLFAIVAFMIIFSALGYPTTPADVGRVDRGTAAEAAGFRPGDRIVGVNGSTIATFADLQAYVALRPDEQMTFAVRRGAREIALNARTRTEMPAANRAAARWEATKPWPPVTRARVTAPAPRSRPRSARAPRRRSRGRRGRRRPCRCPCSPRSPRGGRRAARRRRPALVAARARARCPRRGKRGRRARNRGNHR